MLQQLQHKLSLELLLPGLSTLEAMFKLVALRLEDKFFAVAPVTPAFNI